MATPVLITGGAGFIGCSLARRLVDLGLPVTVLDVLHPQVHGRVERPADLPRGAKLIIGDVTDPVAVADALADARPSTVVHLAAETGTAQSLRSASRHGLVNVVGTTRLLDAMAALDTPPRHVVLASSRAVYGEGQWCDEHGTVFSPGPRLPEDLAAGRFDPVGPTGSPAVALPHRAGTTPTEPASVYGATKLAQEHLLSAWCAATSTALSILRLQNVYGPGQSLTNDYAGVLAGFARTAIAGDVIDVFEDGAIRRDFVFVDDASAAIGAAVLSPPARRRLVDIGTGESVSMLAVAAAIAATADAPPPVVSGRFRNGDVRAAGCDISAASAELRYRPIWSLERGLGALVLSVRRRQLAPAGRRP